MTSADKKNSDLPVRFASAIVMLGVAGMELWLGGLWLDGFIVIVALVTFYEFVTLVTKATSVFWVRTMSIIGGLAYIGLATYLLLRINSVPLLLLIIGLVVAIDVCAYFAGRTIGGPKIAPAISPSKTWAGLGGGIVGALVALQIYSVVAHLRIGVGGTFSFWQLMELLPFAAALAVIAQSGDFFESWLKRRAGVKDSSSLIPGHGGFFDRVDGLLPVAIAIGLVLVLVYPHWLDR